MDRNQAKEFYPILQAYAEGRVIECRTKPSLIEGSDVPNDWTENINNYSEMSIEDLEKLKIKFLSQRDNIENTIGEIVSNIRAKKIQVNNHALREHPYYKDKTSYLKVTINDGTGYTVTKITPGGKCMGIYQFNADNTDFLKYYKICSQSEWDSAIDRLNMWFKDASLKIKEL